MRKNEPEKSPKAGQRDAFHVERWLLDCTSCRPEIVEEIYIAAHDQSLSPAVRALALMLYGEKIAGRSGSSKQPVFDASEGWLRRAYYFGLKYGLPPQPRVVARLLEYEDGLDLSVAYVRECDAAPVFKIKEDLGLALLDSGVDAPGLISLCRALHAIEPLSERLLDASEEIDMILPAMRQVEEAKAIKMRRAQVESLATLIGQYMLRTRSTKVVILLAGFINTMLATAPLTSGLVETIYSALSAFLNFDDEKLVDCLKIEIDQDLGRVTSPAREAIDILERHRGNS